MRVLKGILFVGLISSLFFSCKKDDFDDVPEKDNGILLEIKPNNNSYIGENDNHYYSNAFLSINDTNLYRLYVEADTKYHIFCRQPNQMYSNIKMVLLNSSRDTISVSTINEWNPIIYFNSNITDELYLSVYLNGNYNESLSYNLYFEKSESMPLDFMNYKWEYTGNWIAIDSETLKFTNIDAQKFRWIRLDSSFDNHPNISFTVKSSTNTEVPSFGFIGNGSSNLLYWGDYKEELPDNGTMFNIVNKESYRILNINGTGISFDYGDIKTPKFNLIEGVRINITYNDNGNYDYYSVFINDTFIRNITSGIMNKFFLVIEDRGFNDITFENLKFE